MAPFYGWGSIASRLEPLRGGSLLFTTKFPDIYDTSSLSMMTLSMEHFHHTAYMEHILMSQLQFAGLFMRSVKEALKRSYWSAYYFTNKKGNLYPPTESYIDYHELLLVLPKKRHLFILLYQMKRNYELKAITVLEQLVNEQYAKKQQWPKQGCFLTILNPRNNRGLFS